MVRAGSGGRAARPRAGNDRRAEAAVIMIALLVMAGEISGLLGWW